MLIYNETMNIINKYLSHFPKTTENPNLDSMIFFMNKFHNKHRELKFIHIAGTNGKGSVASNINQVLIEAGYKTGKFITPELLRYNETITVNNKEISNSEIRKILKIIKPIVNERNLQTAIKSFEITVLISIIHFLNNKCDFVVFETGLGGFNDATNFVSSIISIISSIGYDHQNLLGNSIESIAKHKFGIIKENSSVITTCDIPEQKQLQQIIESKKCNLILTDMNHVTQISVGNDASIFIYKDNEYTTSLVGVKQIQNALIAIETMECLRNAGYKISLEDIKNGLSKVVHPARWEIIVKSPTIIFDGAHNEQAILNFVDNINRFYKVAKKIIVFSCLKTKDYQKNIETLKKLENCHIVFTSGINDSFVKGNDLHLIGIKNELNCSVEAKFSRAIKSLKINKEEVCFVLGSFYVYKKTLKILHVKH